MRNLVILVVLGILGMTRICQPGEIPDAVKEYMSQLQSDPTAESGFDYARKLGFLDQKIQFHDWYVGLPFQIYEINIQQLESSTKETEFGDLIVPTNKWRIPVRITDTGYIYHVDVRVYVDGIRAVGGGGSVIGFQTWDKLRTKFPEESGIRPVYIGYPFRLLYFPNMKGGKSIFHARNPKWDDSMSRVTSKSFDKLDDEKTVVPLLRDKVRHLKEQRRNPAQRRKPFGSHPGNSEDTSGGRK